MRCVFRYLHTWAYHDGKVDAVGNVLLNTLKGEAQFAAVVDRVQRITDYERRSGVCPTFREIMAAIREIVAAGFVVLRIKNRFAKSNKTAVDTGGYRDLRLLVYVVDTKLLLEIQLHLECMYKLKTSVSQNKDANGKTGHERYVEFRQLKEGAKLL